MPPIEPIKTVIFALVPEYYVTLGQLWFATLFLASLWFEWRMAKIHR